MKNKIDNFFFDTLDYIQTINDSRDMKKELKEFHNLYMLKVEDITFPNFNKKLLEFMKIFMSIKKEEVKK